MLCDTEKCTGCGSCFNVCPKRSISMEVAENGFSYPVINQTQCIECGLCSQVCPVLNPIGKYKPYAVYSAAYIADNAALYNSSSGGLAYALSEYVINAGGIVFGAAYDEVMNVKHIAVDNIEDLKRLQGSKYVQSDTGKTFSDVKTYLSDNKTVLYFGLPCQIAGLNSFLKNTDTANLITCDLLCGGAPSPEVFKRYIEFLQKKYGKDIKNLNFRSKKYDIGYLLSLDFVDGDSRILYGADAYYIKSLGMGYNRSSCFGCEYASLERVGDLTVGDFPKLKSESPKWKNGISMIMINSTKGNEFYSEISKSIVSVERTIDDVVKSQASAISKKKVKPVDYDDYFADYQKMDWLTFAVKYLKSKSMVRSFLDNLPPAVMVKITKLLRK